MPARIVFIGGKKNEKPMAGESNSRATYDANNCLLEPSRWWPSGKSLEPRGLLPLWSQVRVMWLLI